MPPFSYHGTKGAGVAAKLRLCRTFTCRFYAHYLRMAMTAGWWALPDQQASSELN
jgi:hypothetical protein